MKPRDPNRIIPGVMLLAVGLILLAVNLGWLQIDLWTLFWRFWPLLLILVGLRFLIKNPYIYGGVILIFLGSAIWAVSYAPEHIRNQLRGPAPGEVPVLEHQTLDEALPSDIRRLTFKLDFGAAAVEIKELSEPGQAYQATFENAGQIKEQVEHSGDDLNIKLSQAEGFGTFWRGVSGRRAELALSREIPLDLEVDAGAGKQAFDLSGLRLEKLKLDLGASSSEIKLGDRSNTLDAIIDSGASSLTLRVPTGAGLRIRFDGGLSSNNFEASGLARSGETYETADFGTAAKKITVSLDAGASSVRLERY